MNLYSEIKTSVSNLNSSASVVMLNDASHESENLNYTGSVIRIKTDLSGQASNVENNQAIYNETINIEFITLDEWDNFDINDNADDSSFARIEDMKTLANSVFNDMFYIRSVQNTNSKVTWSYRPVWRKYNGTMTGILVTLKYSDTSTKICNYGV